MSPAPARLADRVAAVRAHLDARTLAAVASWSAAVFAVILLAAWFMAGPEGWRQGSDVPLFLDLLFVGCVTAGFLAVRRYRARWFEESRLAEAIEQATGQAGGSVRGPLELARTVPRGTSKVLAGNAAERALDGMGGSERVLSGRLGERVSSWTRRGLGVLGGLAVALVVVLVLAPERAATAWIGLARPLGLMMDPVLAPLVIGPGDIEVLRGEAVDLDISAPGRATVDLAWQTAGDIARTRTVEMSDGRATHRFESVTATIEYRGRVADGASAGPFRIVPVDPLYVSDLRVEVIYPLHTGLPVEEYRGEVPPLVVPAGTRFVIDGSVSRPLSRAGITDGGGQTVADFEVSDLAFAGAWVPRGSGVFPWRFLDQGGEPAVIQPAPLDLTVEPDGVPQVAIPVPGRDTVLPLDLRQPLVLEARDDYGLERLELVAYRVSAFGERSTPVVQGLALGGTRAALARPLLDLTSWGLAPGDTVRYFARVTDNAPAGQTAVTREYVLRMPAAAEMRREAERRIEDVGQRLEEMALEAADRADEMRDMEREASAAQDDARAPGQPNADEAAEFAEREELRRAMEGQQEMAAEVDSLRAELSALQKAMEDAGQADPELRGDLQELQELLKEVAAVEQKQGPESSMDEMAKRQEDFRDRLEESLERFRRAAVEQDFRATESEAQELADQQEALAEAMKEGDQPELRADQQEALEQRAEELESRMELLQERLEQLGEEDAAREVGEARQQAADAGQKMEQARQQAREGREQEAGEQASEASEAMQETADNLSEAQQQMAQQQAEAVQRALQGAADDALSLARRQSELREQMRGASQDQLAGMRADEASLLQGVRNMAQNLQEATEDGMEQSRELSTQMGRAMESLQKTIEALENRRGPTPAPQAAAEQAVGDLNQLALMALAGAEQMSQGQGQGQPSQEQMSEQMQQLAQQQGQLNDQASQLMPMQLGQQAMAQQMQQLAQQQESVAEELGEMSEKPGSEESTLGDLEDLAAEAREVAQRMNEGRLDPELLKRQERLFHRLLDAGRSLEQEEFSEERESAGANAFERGDVVPLTPEQLGALRFRLPDPEQLQRLSPAVRRLVIQYFERLNVPDRPPPVPEALP